MANPWNPCTNQPPPAVRSITSISSTRCSRTTSRNRQRSRIGSSGQRSKPAMRRIDELATARFSSPQRAGNGRFCSNWKRRPCAGVFVVRGCWCRRYPGEAPVGPHAFRSGQHRTVRMACDDPVAPPPGTPMAFTFGPGLALKMYPAELLKYGAKCLASDGEPVDAEHYFVCLKADASGGLWTPLHVVRGHDREPIPE